MTTALMTAAQLDEFLEREFPQVNRDGRNYSIESAGYGHSLLRLHYGEKHLRPGGTVSGPAMFALADLAIYVAVLASIGPVALAVTTNLSINFLSRPRAGDLLGACRMLKIGKRLAMGQVSIFTENSDDVIAHATGTYSLPPR